MMNIAESPCLKSIFAIWGSGDKTTFDQEAAFSAHITIREWPLIRNFPVTVTSNLNLTLYKYGCTEHLPYSNQDLGVQCPTPSKLDLYICEESRFTKFRIYFGGVLIVLLVLVLFVTETE